MTLTAFFLGLFLGIGFLCLWQMWLYEQLQQIMSGLHNEEHSVALPMISRLRRAIAASNQQRQQLQVQVQTWQLILQNAPVGYLEVDEENQLRWCNEQARRLLNIQHWEPERLRLLLKVVRSYELDQLIEQTRARQQPDEREWVFHPAIADAEAMGRVRAIALRGYSWPLPSGHVGVFLENRQELIDLSGDRNRWVSDLAHELRTPLTSIRLVAEALQDRLETPMRTWVDRMLGETNRLIQLVQDWLDLSQLEIDPSKNLTRQPLELQSLIQSVWGTLEPLTKQKQLSIAYSAPEKLWLAADESRLYRVFLNLFDNSIRYSPPQATIQVNVTVFPATVDRASIVAGPYLQIDIIDSGPGFAEADLPHVFERLYRGERSRARSIPITDRHSNPSGDRDWPQQKTPASPSSGLGLAIVRQIVLAHGGSVTAQNHPQTGGAWLQILFSIPFSIPERDS